MEDGTILRDDNLEVIRDAIYRRRGGAIILRKAGSAGIPAVRATECFRPLFVQGGLLLVLLSLFLEQLWLRRRCRKTRDPVPTSVSLFRREIPCRRVKPVIDSRDLRLRRSDTGLKLPSIRVFCSPNWATGIAWSSSRQTGDFINAKAIRTCRMS
jgi:hypothetical protein